MDTDSWYKHPKYQPYWRHYKEMQNWYEQNKEIFWQMFSPLMGNRTQHSSETCSRCHRSYHPRNTPSQGRDDLNSRSRRRSVNSNNRQRYDCHENSFHNEYVSNFEESEESEVSLEMEITEEMIAFLEHSEKHRQELRALREKEASEEANVEEIKPKNGHRKKGKNSKKKTTQPPRIRPGVQRTAEMKLLYGKNAAMIHGMETAMQLNFDRNCDINQPKLWPNIPLNL